jgi:hypothetical protein
MRGTATITLRSMITLSPARARTGGRLGSVPLTRACVMQHNACTHARMHPRTHACMHARTHARMHACVARACAGTRVCRQRAFPCPPLPYPRARMRATLGGYLPQQRAMAQGAFAAVRLWAGCCGTCIPLVTGSAPISTTFMFSNDFHSSSFTTALT